MCFEDIRLIQLDQGVSFYKSSVSVVLDVADSLKIKNRTEISVADYESDS